MRIYKNLFFLFFIFFVLNLKVSLKSMLTFDEVATEINGFMLDQFPEEGSSKLRGLNYEELARRVQERFNNSTAFTDGIIENLNELYRGSLVFQLDPEVGLVVVDPLVMHVMQEVEKMVIRFRPRGYEVLTAQQCVQIKNQALEVLGNRQGDLLLQLVVELSRFVGKGKYADIFNIEFDGREFSLTPPRLDV